MMADTEVPPFLSISRRYRDQFEYFDPNYNNNNAASKGLQNLLATEDAAELLISFLSNEGTSIVWLSNDCFLSKFRDLHWLDIHWLDTRRQFARLCYFILQSPELKIKDFTLSLYRVSGTRKSSLVGVVDTMLGLLAKHKSLTRIELCGDVGFMSTSPAFVASLFRLPCLKAYVSQAQSPRQLSFDKIRLSPDQWRVIACHCNKNVSLDFGGGRFDWWDGGIPLVDAIQHNACPTKIRFCGGFETIQEVKFRALLDALKENSSLQELSLSDKGGVMTTERRMLFLEAISQNSGLIKLDLGRINNMADREWKILWGNVAFLHPTLKAILLPSCRLGNFLTPPPAVTRALISSPSRRRSSKLHDLILIQSVRANTVLTELDCGRAVHNQKIVREQVQPILELNRFRRRVKAIEQEQDPTLKEILFASALLDGGVRGQPSLAFLLLSENASLWVRRTSALHPSPPC